MLSKKMAFSLTSLITLLVFTFVAGDAFAAAKPFEITITGPTKATSTSVTTDATVDLIVESAHAIPELTIAGADSDPPTNNVSAVAIDRRGFVVDGAAIAVTDRPIGEYPMRTATKRQLRVVITQTADPQDGTKGNIERVIVSIPAGLATTDPTIQATDGTDTMLNVSALVQHTITLSLESDRTNLPKVVSVQRLRPGSQTVVAAFQEEIVTDTSFDVRIVLTEAHTADPLTAANLVEIENGTASDLVVGVPFTRIGVGANDAAIAAAWNTLRPHPVEGMYEHSGFGPLAGVPNTVAAEAGADAVPVPTGDDEMYRQYRVTITPHTIEGDPDTSFEVKVRVREFHDGGAPVRNTYVPPGFGDSDFLPNGRDILTVNVAYTAVDLRAGYKVVVPADIRIPGSGYLVIAQSEAGSAVVVPPGSKKDPPDPTERTPVEMIYNVIEIAETPNLATQFLNGVVLDVESQHAGLVISEIMWGEDVSLPTSSNSQYIELYNPGDDYVTIPDKLETADINEALTLIFYRPNEFGSVPAVNADGTLPDGVTDRVGTLDADGAYWSPATVGSSGRSGVGEGELTLGRGEFVDAVPIVSMYRVMDADGTIDTMMGQESASWMSSEGPKSANFDPLAIGIRHGTPGAATDATDTPADVAADEAEAQKVIDDDAEDKRTTGTIPEAGQVYISEIMVAGGGVLPQWIEIANGSKTEDVNLSGWTLTIANAAADADVSIGASATFTIPDGTIVAMSGQQKDPSTILVVTEAGRNNVDGSGQVVNLMKDNEVELILAGVTTRKYTILSSDAFSITLAPGEPEDMDPPEGETANEKAKREADEKKAKAKRMAASDTVGNLGADGAAAWALPMSEDGRSSLIRRHVQVAVGPAEPEDGTMMENWVLASDTSFAQPTHIRAQSYYGAMNDSGTPGFRAGGALPVELSHFRPARDKATGAVVITWATESELNNAGFFIKRSNQKDGEFTVINATMVAGAGTTSEKQFYTYTDTTAQPNVVYYYQIEDVSLDGNRQTLTRGIRLKGHVSVAGKATLTWGELKSSHE